VNDIGPCLKEAILRLDEIGPCNRWYDFAMTGKNGRYNAMNALKKRRWIEDANERARNCYSASYGYEPPVAPIKKFPRRWQLTDAGKSAVAALREQRPDD